MSSIVYDGNSDRNTKYNKYPNLVPTKNVYYSPISKKNQYNNKGDNYGINKNKIQKVNQNITNNIEENGETESEIQKKNRVSVCLCRQASV